MWKQVTSPYTPDDRNARINLLKKYYYLFYFFRIYIVWLQSFFVIGKYFYDANARFPSCSDTIVIVIFLVLY